jgi:hypothetical protein
LRVVIAGISIEGQVFTWQSVCSHMEGPKAFIEVGISINGFLPLPLPLPDFFTAYCQLLIKGAKSCAPTSY